MAEHIIYDEEVELYEFPIEIGQSIIETEAFLKTHCDKYPNESGHIRILIEYRNYPKDH